jgi:exosome complex component RRP42
MTKENLIKSLKAGMRYDGRKFEEMREVSIEPNVSNSAEGSVRVKFGKTEVIVGVKMGLETPYPDTPDQGNLMVNAELLPLSSPEFESGPPGIEAIEIARVVDRGIRESKAIDQKKLCIKAGEQVWSVMVDICTINDAGNLLDASALGAVAALKNAKFPKIDGDVLDYSEHTTKVPLDHEPITITAWKIGDTVVVDPLPEEEKAVDARLTTAIIKDGSLRAMQKGGSEPLTIDEIDKMVGLAQEKAKELRSKL